MQLLFGDEDARTAQNASSGAAAGGHHVQLNFELSLELPEEAA